MANRSVENGPVESDAEPAEADAGGRVGDAYLSPLADFLLLAALTVLCALALVVVL